MNVEYNLDDSLCFPDNLFYKFIDDFHILLAIYNPNWIILNDSEYKMFSYLRQGMSIRKTLEKYYQCNYENEEECLLIMKKLLKQITDNDFFENVQIEEEDKIEDIVKNVHIITTNDCNMRCNHCYMSAGFGIKQSIDTGKIIKIINQLNEIYGNLEIVVSGGEPLIYQDIYNLLEKIKNNYIILFTNGSLITKDSIKVISKCCNEVQISFEGISRRTYGKIRGNKNYDRVLQAIELLKSENMKIVFAITILPSTIQDISDNFIDFVKSLNYSNIEIRINDEIEISGNALKMNLSNYNKLNSKSFVIKMINKLEGIGYKVKNNKLIRNKRITNCGIGTSIVINYDGKIYPCHKFSKFSLTDNIEVDKIIKKFNNINIETSNNNILKCKTCELRYICSGGCRIDNYNKTGDMNTIICNNEFKENQFRKLIYDYQISKIKIDE